MTRFEGYLLPNLPSFPDFLWKINLHYSTNNCTRGRLKPLSSPCNHACTIKVLNCFHYFYYYYYFIIIKCYYSRICSQNRTGSPVTSFIIIFRGLLDRRLRVQQRIDPTNPSLYFSVVISRTYQHTLVFRFDFFFFFFNLTIIIFYESTFCYYQITTELWLFHYRRTKNTTFFFDLLFIIHWSSLSLTRSRVFNILGMPNYH